MDLSARYEELCYYLGLCLPGYSLQQILEKDVGEWPMQNKLVLDTMKH